MIVKLIDFNASLLIEDRFYARLDERWARPPEQRERPRHRQADHTGPDHHAINLLDQTGRSSTVQGSITES